MIQIHEKLRPFAHRPGTPCLVPGSAWVVEPFPALLRVLGMGDFPIGLTGPVREFTVQMDLEKECVWVWGKAVEGYFRYALQANGDGLSLFLDRAPGPIRIGDAVVAPKSSQMLARGGLWLEKKPLFERISLGRTAAQNVERFRCELDLAEIAPILFVLGQKVPAAPCALAEENLTALFLGAFSGLFVPQLEDPLHQGIPLQLAECKDPLSLLPAIYAKIRSWLLDGDRVLPVLPRTWEAGRAVGFRTPHGLLDLEWRKHSIYRMVLHSETAPEFVFQPHARTFRRRLENGATHFDRFQK